MKTIPLREVANDKQKLSTRDIILGIARTPEPGKGIDYVEMKKRVRIINAIDKLTPDEKQLVLEDADYDHLVSLTRTFRFGAADPKLLDMINEIMTAK